MNRINISVNNIFQVLEYYNHIKVYRADVISGPYNEITIPSTIIPLTINRTVYYYDDVNGVPGQYYKTSYYHVEDDRESELSDPIQSGTRIDKIGYSFNNYSSPPGEFGNLLTPDDMRYTYLYGIDAVAQDSNRSEFTDEQFLFAVEDAIADFEKYLTICIKRRIFKTKPDPALQRAVEWRNGVDYTDEDDPYDFDPMLWQNYGFIQLRHAPVISIERCVLKSPVGGVIMDLVSQNWIRLEKDSGQLRLFPTQGASYGPYAVGSLPWRALGSAYPDAFEIDYTAGYINSDFVPKDLRSVIGKWAAVKALNQVGDGLLAGFSSQSVSLDGLSESFSSTQSATSAYFGARILQYQKEISEWLQRNRYKYGKIPMGFVGF